MVTPPGYSTAKLLRPCYWSRWNPGTGEPVEAWFDNCTVAVVTSKQYPLTAYFEFSALVDNNASVSAMTPSDLMARELDNRIVARASAMPTVTIPAGIGNGSEWEGTIMLAIQAQITVLPGHTVSLWHGLVNFGQFVSYNVVLGGQTYKLYVGDTITIQYANGQTVKVTFQGPQTTIPWKRVDETLRNADGTDPNNPTPTTSTATYGVQSFAYTYEGSTFNVSYVPVVYNAPASRIDRQGVITITTITTVNGLLKETKYQD